MNVVMLYFYSKRFCFAPSFNNNKEINTYNGFRLLGSVVSASRAILRSIPQISILGNPLEPVCCKKWQKIVPDQLLV